MKDYLKLTCEDNMDLMSRYEDNHFDLAIVDPPYGIDLANMNMGIGKTKKASKAKNRKWVSKDWDKEVPSELFFKQLFRVSKNQIIWGGNYFDLPPSNKFIIWDKEIPLGLSFSDCEFAWTSFSGANKMFRYSAYKDKKVKFHPTQKSVTLYQWLLKNYAKEGDKILDTHLGSMSIAIAVDSVNKIEGMNLELTGCELDPEYYQKGIERVESETKWESVFQDAPLIVEQTKMF